MTGVMVNVAMLGVFLFGLLTLARLLMFRVLLPPVRMTRRIKPRHEAVALSATDRFIRDQEHELWPDRTFNHVNCTVCGPGPLLRGQVPSSYQHPFFIMEQQTHSDGYGGHWQTTHPKAALPERAEMVSSEIIDDGKSTGIHTVMLDLDFPVTLMESSTPGHHHLYIDHLLSWREYQGLLRALTKVGLIEQGYYTAAVRQHATMLRPPWVTKPNGALPKPKPKRRWDTTYVRKAMRYKSGKWTRLAR
jgi:hypothetical protein